MRSVLYIASASNLINTDFSALATAQRNNTKVIVVRDKPHNLHLREVHIPPCAVPFLCDVSTCTPHLVIPLNFWCTVFDALNLSHPGICAMQHLVMQCYVWLGIDKDVRAWACCSLVCQQSKLYRHTRARGTGRMAKRSNVQTSKEAPESMCRGHVNFLLPVKHDVTHQIIMTGPPTNARARPLPPD